MAAPVEVDAAQSAVKRAWRVRWRPWRSRLFAVPSGTPAALAISAVGDHDVIILHEVPDRGRTIIEKFEDEASAAAYAVILFTGDDVGGLGAAAADQPRARQNVIFELGWFAGRLGRSRVTVLYEGGVERPSDYGGVTYTPLDDQGAWRLKLVRELMAAGLSFDANRLRG